MISYIKIAGALALVAVLFGAGYHVADLKGKAATAHVQHLWDVNKAEIAKLAADESAANARKFVAAITTNEGVTHDLQIQVDSLRDLNSTLASRLRLATDSPTGRGVLPKVTNNPGPISAAINDSVGAVDDAIAAALTECAVNRENYNALILELKPQLAGFNILRMPRDYSPRYERFDLKFALFHEF
jgi:hypothetical protein